MPSSFTPLLITEEGIFIETNNEIIFIVIPSFLLEEISLGFHYTLELRAQGLHRNYILKKEKINPSLINLVK